MIYNVYLVLGNVYAVLRVFCWISVYIQYLILLLLNELAIYYVSVVVLIGVGTGPLPSL